MFYDIKEIKYVLKGKGSTLRSSYQAVSVLKDLRANLRQKNGT